MSATTEFELPTRRGLFFGGEWHAPLGGSEMTVNPATQESLGTVSVANKEDVDLAVKAAHEAFKSWRLVKPIERARLLRELAAKVRDRADEFAWLDSLNCGNPIKEMARDAVIAAAQIEYFAGLVHETKGDTVPMGDGVLNYTLREPLGVVARIVAYNHPLMFLASKLAPVVAAGNTVILKPPAQAPLSGYLLAELVSEVFPPGVINIISGDRECGEALVAHPLVRKAALIGSTATGAAILKGAADKIMPVTLELGGKNPLVICGDANLDKAIQGAVSGMNFLWAGQSCGSTSRLFVHRSVYERVLSSMKHLIVEQHKCGMPTDPKTTMGCLISKPQFDKVMGFIESARAEGARLICGGGPPDDPALAKGWFVEPTVFADVTPEMRLFREEVFGPVLAVIPWDDEETLLEQINSVEYGLTASIWTKDLARAHRLAGRVESGFVWINYVSSHFIGAEFGGYKKSGMGREEGLSELLSYTQTKNVHVSLT
ncbi:aldehyde dehydrogenase family protein [Paraburkholderia sprentiae WSM5005]|uniref:Aldehyde dehydrogenase family protein n=1 Tax=Paraburkholderia sprentiae WSM5005 TaxID=754502 RepID=A0A1I9YEN8_9BURK|nr:aldehyde dehydrogenase family protein [Paraburkholderia sprentiae]APA84771.1 aldehyde dehydrogenase family protein [Paraburkholderia sprentiae WSM5005]